MQPVQSCQAFCVRFDAAADLKRKSETAKDLGETAAIKHKRNKL